MTIVIFFLQIEVTNVKQLRKFKYLGNALTDNGKFDTIIRIRVRIAKDYFHQLSKETDHFARN